MKPGGTEGGERSFLLGVGFILFAIGLYFLLDSVRVTTAGYGYFSGAMGRRGGMGETTSMGILFVPFIVGTGVLFFDARKKWAWILAGIGLLILVIEIMSRIRFRMETKVTHLLLILVMIAAGAGFLARGYLAQNRRSRPDGGTDPEQPPV
ncbi:MAG: hypothetical protein HKN82_02755 [Akkermansiaceae bacterium]|nr:hypothetical protein [Akkermansiaceae bacterium]